MDSDPGGKCRPHRHQKEKTSARIWYAPADHLDGVFPPFGVGFGGLTISDEGGLELLDEFFSARAKRSSNAAN